MVYYDHRNRRRRARAREKAKAALPPCPLLDRLPQEIRDRILELLLHPRFRFRIQISVGTRCGLSKNHLDVNVWNTFSCLSATCHQLRMDATHALTRINTFYIVCRPSFVDKLYRRNSTKPRWAPDATKGWPLIPVPNRALESMKHILIEAERPAISFLKGSNRVPRLSCDLLVERLESGFVADFTKMPGLHNISHLRHGITGSPEIGQLVSGFVRSAPAVIEELLNTSPLGLRTLQQIVQIMVDMGVPPDDTFQSPSPHQNELPDQDYVRQMGFGSLHSFRITGSRSVQQHTPSYEWLYNSGEDMRG